MDSHRDEAGDVRDVGQQIRADFAGDFAHALEINDARIRAGADGDHPRLVLARHGGELVVINPLVVLAHAVVDDFKKFAGEIRLVAVGQMAAVAQIHREHLVAGFEHGKIDGHVRLAAGMRLDVGVFRAEQFFRAVNGELLDGVNVFAAAIPAFLRQALGVFVREHGALGFQHRRADKIFAGDQLDVFLLAHAARARWLRPRRDPRCAGGVAAAASRTSILSTRRSWRPPSNFAARNASRIFLASFGGVVLPLRQSTLASLCWRASAAACSSATSAARTPGTLLAAMHMPTPLVQTSRPSSARPVGDGLRHRLGEIGIIVGRLLRFARQNP